MLLGVICVTWVITLNTQLYFGQTCNRFHVRLNGHRACFRIDNLALEKSELSRHIMTDHPSHFGDKFSTFNFGIIKKVASRNLDRAQDFSSFLIVDRIFLALIVIKFSSRVLFSQYPKICHTMSSGVLSGLVWVTLVDYILPIICFP